MKNYYKLFITLLIISSSKTLFAQELDKIHDMSFYSFGDRDKIVYVTDFGIAISCYRGMMNELVDYVSIDGKVIKDKKPGSAYFSDSSKFIIGSILKDKIVLNVYHTNDLTSDQTITTKNVDQILKEFGYEIKRGIITNNSFSHRIDDIEAIGSTFILSVKSTSGSVYVDTKFYFDLNHPDDIFPIVPKFPELNDDADKEYQVWDFEEFDSELKMFIYQRKYRIKEGADKGKRAIAIAYFDTKLKLIKLLDFNLYIERFKSKESLYTGILYDDRKYFYTLNLVKLEKKIKEGKYVLFLKKFDSNGKEIWQNSDFDPQYEDYEHFYSYYYQIDTKKSLIKYDFRIRFQEYTNTFNMSDGKLLKKEEKKNMNMNTDVNNHQDIDDPKLAKIVNREMTANKHEEYKVYKFGKQNRYLVTFRAKGRHYLFYRY